MGKTIGFLLAVLGIWTTVEIYTKGTDRAFDGLLARFGLAEEGPDRAPATERARAAVERAHDAQRDRFESLLPD